MSTHSMIGFQEYDGSIRAIYCHFDGYIEHNGLILQRYYNTIEAVEELLDLGSLSVLGPEIGEAHPFSVHELTLVNEVEYEKLYGKMCLAYGRDRGESNEEANEYISINSLKIENKHCEFIYIFDGNKWFVNGNIDLEKYLNKAGLIENFA